MVEESRGGLEVAFLDVGQGASAVILLGSGRAIVIDCGRTADATLKFLASRRVSKLQLLLISHSDNDHSGGASAVFRDYGVNVEQIGIVFDHKFLESDLWSTIGASIRTDAYPAGRVFRIESDAQPRCLYSDGRCTLEVLAPLCVENVEAISAADSNGTCAVFRFVVADTTFLFSGDAPFRVWKEIRTRRGTPIDCAYFAVPHHGGGMSCTTDEMRWLYTHAVSARFATVSVGTRNPYGHPRPDLISTIVRSGAKPICTQMTTQCCQNFGSLLSLMGGELDPGKGASGVSCAGSVVVGVLPTGEHRWVGADRHSDVLHHLESVEPLPPLCRR